MRGWVVCWVFWVKVQREREREGDLTRAALMKRFCRMVLPSDEMRFLMETVITPSVNGVLVGFIVALVVVVVRVHYLGGTRGNSSWVCE